MPFHHLPFSHFDFVTSRLAVGAGPIDEADIGTLISKGITAICDNRDDVDDSRFLGRYEGSVKYFWNPTKDDGKHGLEKQEWIKRGVLWALPLLGDQHEVLYSHCKTGIERGPSMLYAWLRAAYGLYRDDAKLLIRLHRLRDLFGIRYANDADAALESLGYK